MFHILVASQVIDFPVRSLIWVLACLSIKWVWDASLMSPHSIYMVDMQSWRWVQRWRLQPMSCGEPGMWHWDRWWADAGKGCAIHCPSPWQSHMESRSHCTEMEAPVNISLQVQWRGKKILPTLAATWRMWFHQVSQRKAKGSKEELGESNVGGCTQAHQWSIQGQWFGFLDSGFVAADCFEAIPSRPQGLHRPSWVEILGAYLEQETEPELVTS